MYSANHSIPKQKLADSKKTETWKKECVEAYIGLSNTNGYGNRRSKLQQLYDYYNGHVEEEDYKYVTKPYGKSRSNFPSKIRNYPIIKPIIDLLLGEKSKRPLNYSVVVKNADTVSTKEQQKQAMLMQVMQQKFINRLNEQGMQTGMASEEVQMPKHVAELFEKSYVDARAILGQQALNYIMQEQEMYDKFQKAWFHFLVSGECYTHRGVRHNEPFYEVLNPVDIDYDKDPDCEFVEDGDWALVRKFSHASTIVDMYREELTDGQIDRLERPEQFSNDSHLSSGYSQHNVEQYRSRLIEVNIVYWKSMKRIGFLSFINPDTGQKEEEIVPSNFKMPEELKDLEAEISFEWVTEVWQGTKIADDIFVEIQPVENQRFTLDNPSNGKLPINGRKYSETNSENISLVGLGVPYQINYNIYKYRLEVAIAKSKDIIAQFDINMIPKKWDMDKFMYYVDATGIAWVDYNKEGMTMNPQHQAVMDMSIKTIEQYVVLLESIIQEWERISGVNRQRQGTIGTYAGKGTSQQAIVQSSHITEDLFRKFSRLEQRDIQAVLDYSKDAWNGSKSSMYYMPDGTAEFFSIDGTDYSESNYGIFASNAGADLEKKMKVEQLAQAMIQNGTPASVVAEAMDQDSFTAIKDKIKAAEKQSQELEQAQQQAQMEMQQKQLQAQNEQKAMEMENSDKNRQTQIEVALINAEANQELKRQELLLKAQELSDKNDNMDDKIRLEEKRIDTTLKIAKENKKNGPNK
jgi:hypothetical protein|tara:strand:+ start:1290 stop:3530 length:2241 start_codon:yes stop_codon:yes gene_type:complete